MVCFWGVMIVLLYLEIVRLAIGGSKVHDLFLNGPLLMFNGQFFRFFIHTPPDHLNEIWVGVTHLTLALKHQEKSIFNRIFISSVDELGHLRPLLAQFQEQTHQIVILFISPRPSKIGFVLLFQIWPEETSIMFPTLLPCPEDLLLPLLIESLTDALPVQPVGILIFNDAQKQLSLLAGPRCMGDTRGT